jgi:hypothetical protein
MHARRAVLRIFSSELPEVIARKMGTTPTGSTTKRTAGSETRNSDSCSFMRPLYTERRSFHTIVRASRKIFRLILDCPTRRSSKTMGISFTVKPFFRLR